MAEKKRPLTHIAFSATKTFTERWPREAAIQQAAFETPTWQTQKCEEVHKNLDMSGNEKSEAVGVPIHAKIDDELAFKLLCVGFLAGAILGGTIIYFYTR